MIFNTLQKNNYILFNTALGKNKSIEVKENKYPKNLKC
jgi:hypothetical protein